MFDLPHIDALDHATGRGVSILFMDTGVDVGYPPLAGRSIPAWEIGRRQIVACEGESRDPSGHGSVVASLIARQAPGAKLESLAVLGADEMGVPAATIAGLRWALDRGFDIVNWSFSTGSPSEALQRELSPLLARCVATGTIVVAAWADPWRDEFPASLPAVIEAASAPRGRPDVVHLHTGRRAEFAVCGEIDDVPPIHSMRPPIAGASFAAAHMTAIIARLRELQPEWGVREMRRVLRALALRSEPSTYAILDRQLQHRVRPD